MLNIGIQYFGGRGSGGGGSARGGGGGGSQSISKENTATQKQSFTNEEAKKIANEAKFVKTSAPGGWSTYEADTPIGHVTITENRQYMGKSWQNRWYVSAYGLNYGSGSPQGAKTLSDAKKLGRQMLFWKS